MFSKKNSEIKCDICGGQSFSEFRKIKKHRYDRCNKCKTIVLSTRGLNDHSPVTYLDNPESYLSIVNPHGTRYMAGCVDHAHATKIGGAKGSLLEIGSGLGFLSYTLFSRGWEVESMELSEAAAKWARKIFKLPVDTHLIEDYKTETKFDAVVLVEVIEHFYDPKQVLGQIRDLMADKSLIFGTTPNTESQHWVKSEQNIYEPSDHIVLFTAKSLKKILKDAGFKKVTIETFGVGDKNDSNLMFSGVK
jgi:2-polyprenyl-3-methyl-5-hydroxy-6-metoxy-1,4-benzoquinol methylase